MELSHGDTDPVVKMPLAVGTGKLRLLLQPTDPTAGTMLGSGFLLPSTAAFQPNYCRWSGFYPIQAAKTDVENWKGC